MADLFEKFPEVENDMVIIRKMKISDVSALSEISNNDNVYKYIPPFLYKKNDKFLTTAIQNLSERDFLKKKLIIAGIYLKSNPNRLVGLAEMFDYKRRDNKITIGYRINESYWNQKVATNALSLMVEYLVNEIGILKIEAYVMPENIFSSRVLLHNGFEKENFTAQKKNWGGQEEVTVDVYTFTSIRKNELANSN